MPLYGGVPSGWDFADQTPDWIEPFSMLDADQTIAVTDSRLHLTIFRAKASKTVSNIATKTRGTAGTVPVTQRMLLCSVDQAAQTYTVLAETSNDATLFVATFTPYERTFNNARGGATSVNIVAGDWYAFGTFADVTVAPAFYGWGSTSMNFTGQIKGRSGALQSGVMADTPSPNTPTSFSAYTAVGSAIYSAAF